MSCRLLSSTPLEPDFPSTKARELIDQFSDLDYVPAIVVLEDNGGVSKGCTNNLKELASTLDDERLLAQCL